MSPMAERIIQTGTARKRWFIVFGGRADLFFFKWNYNELPSGKLT